MKSVMKSVWCMTWIVSALLVIATVDTVPDPPGVTPSTTTCHIAPVHHRACDTAAPRCDSLGTAQPFPVGLAAADACEPCPPSDRMALTAQAADPSPPIAHS